jgi:hypothetical protein
MPAVTLRAHYDGKHLVPDEPANLPIDTPLAVTVYPAAGPGALAEERAGLTALASQCLARAYGDDEPEYTLADLKP